MSGIRVAIYAHYSSDSQLKHSIDDQVRICRERAERENWTPPEPPLALMRRG